MRVAFRSASLAVALTLSSTAVPGAALPQMRLVPYATGFSLPVAIVQDPTDSHVQFVVEQRGVVRTVVDGVVQSAPFLDLAGNGVVLCCGERGLLGLAFPPDAAASGRFYVNFTRNPDGHIVVARLTRSSNPRVANPLVQRLTWSPDPQLGPLDYIPHPIAGNHNGGCLQFGPDGHLYVATGDGGGGNDTFDNAQRASSLLGRILRIDVSGTNAAAAAPADNPFVGNAAYRPEIWDVGLRNPWRFSFDDPARGGTGAMVIGDVGQSQFEEIDYEPRGRGGRNYGWPAFEGFAPLLPRTLLFPRKDPVYAYGRTLGASITGGYVYRGSNIPDLRGRYVFADFVFGRIYSIGLRLDAQGEATMTDIAEHTSTLGVKIPNISSFGVDANGELFVLDYGGGIVYRLRNVPKPPSNLRIIR